MLNGGGDDVAYQDAVAHLMALGYRVLASGSTRRAYEETTILFAEDRANEAGALQAADPRFRAVLPNDVGLSDQVDLHVVVGPDWLSAVD